MLRIALENVETLERERERESNNTRNIATKIALVCAPKINILKNEKLVIW